MVEIIDIRGGMTVARVLTIDLEEPEAKKFLERFNKVNVPTDKRVMNRGRYMYARLAGPSRGIDRLFDGPE